MDNCTDNHMDNLIDNRTDNRMDNITIQISWMKNEKRVHDGFFS